MHTWIEIDLDAVRANYMQACMLSNARITAVLKSNAYGHGAVQIAHLLEECGCTSFAVSCMREALELRRHDIHSDILVMGTCDEKESLQGVEQDITLSASSFLTLKNAAYASEKLGKNAIVELKVDTGFHRLGFPADHDCLAEAVEWIRQHSGLAVRGMYSHLGLISEELDRKQNERFLEAFHVFEESGLRIPEKHLCDSIGLVRYPQWHYDRVRIGAFLFGVRPSRSDHMPFQDLETLCLKAAVIQLHSVHKGEAVGYSDDMVMERDSRIATISVGYGDGYPRMLSNGRGSALIRGRRCPVVGLVCMDQMMVDVTDVPDAAEGDTAVLLGKGISLNEYSDWAQTNRNECLARLGSRPVRQYFSGGRCISMHDALA